MKKFLESLKCLHPNRELSKESAIWTIIAIALMAFALWVVFTANWQTEGFYRAGYKDGKLTEIVEVFKACRFSIVPHMMSTLCAVFIFGALWVRNYGLKLGNLYALVLLMADVLFIASLVESFLPAKEVCLFRMLGCDVLAFSPLKLLFFVILLGWLGMRTLSGFSIILLIFAFWSRTIELDVMDFWGVAYLLCGVFSFVVQFCKLPYIVPDGGFTASLRRDFWGVKTQVHQNLMASVEATEKVAVAAAAVAAPAVGSALKKTIGGKPDKPQIGE